jgi:hypothetical protein
MPEWLNAQLIPAYANGLSVLMDRFVTSRMSTCPRPAPRCSRDSLERGQM